MPFFSVSPKGPLLVFPFLGAACATEQGIDRAQNKQRRGWDSNLKQKKQSKEKTAQRRLGWGKKGRGEIRSRRT